MPKFLDVHHLKPFDEETLRKLQQSPVDEFGIKHLNMMYNKEEDKFFCLLEAPNKEAVEKHHNKAGVKCEWITEVETTA
ncbi:MAG TPA: nickel-binding protein [Nitrososphaeraceae archaeon]